MSGEASGSPSALGSLASPSHLEVVCGRWTVDAHLPSVSHPFLRMWAGMFLSNPGTLRQQPQCLSVERTQGGAGGDAKWALS